jgi:carbon-monoxide dehydrogenase medium subunit
MLITVPFAHDRPASLEEALTLLSEFGPSATVYAGGTELVPVMKMGLATFDRLIDLKRIPELTVIERVPDGLRIGSTVTHHRLVTSDIVRSAVPSLSVVAAGIGNIRVRVTGTIGGNLCFAEPRSDPLTLLSALRARITLVGAHGRRELPVADFVTGPYSTQRAADELVVDIIIPADDGVVTFRKLALAERPVASVACVRRPSTGGDDLLTFVVGSVGPVPTSFGPAVVQFRDEPGLESVAAGIADVCDAESDEHGSEDYKRHLVRVLVRRAARAAWGDDAG